MAFNAENEYYSPTLISADCEKDHCHKNYISIKDFNIKHLPEEYQEHETVNYINSVADLTVRVAVATTSTDRPAFGPGTKQPYAFYDMRGSRIERVGSGIVYKVIRNSNECQCLKCQHSDTPSKVCGEIWVVTAAHVVFDEIEAQKTTCRLFFDRPDSPLLTIDGFTVVDTNVERDRSIIKKLTCDVELLNKLHSFFRKSEVLRFRLIQRYWITSDKDKLCIITSHPHGCEKQVSVGHWIEKFLSGAETTKYTYSTHSCPGSGGAPVVIFSRLDYKGYHTHHSVNEKGQYFSGTFIG